MIRAENQSQNWLWSGSPIRLSSVKFEDCSIMFNNSFKNYLARESCNGHSGKSPPGKIPSLGERACDRENQTSAHTHRFYILQSRRSSVVFHKYVNIARSEVQCRDASDDRFFQGSLRIGTPSAPISTPNHQTVGTAVVPESLFLYPLYYHTLWTRKCVFTKNGVPNYNIHFSRNWKNNLPHSFFESSYLHNSWHLNWESS